VEGFGSKLEPWARKNDILGENPSGKGGQRTGSFVVDPLKEEQGERGRPMNRVTNCQQKAANQDKLKRGQIRTAHKMGIKNKGFPPPLRAKG